jgi:hypothetical protein
MIAGAGALIPSNLLCFRRGHGDTDHIVSSFVDAMLQVGSDQVIVLYDEYPCAPAFAALCPVPLSAAESGRTSLPLRGKLTTSRIETPL